MKFWGPQKRKFKLLADSTDSIFPGFKKAFLLYFYDTPRLGVPFLYSSFLMVHPYGENAVGKKFKLFLSLSFLIVHPYGESKDCKRNK